MQKNRVTLQDIAQECGTTKAVTSVVLRGNTSSIRYSSKTRDKILATAKRMGYLPSRASRQINRQKEGAIGVLFRSHYAIPTRAYNGLYPAMAETDSLLVFEQLKPDDQLPLMILERSVDGVIIFEDLGATVLKWLENYNIPYVAVNALLESALFRVEMNEIRVVEHMLNLFEKAGRKNCAWVFHKNDQYTIYRRNLLISACKARSWPTPHFVNLQDKTEICDRDQILNFLQDFPELNAVILLYDIMAPVICDVLAELGKSVPDDVSLIGIHNSKADQFMQPPLDAVEGCFDLAAKMAVELLIEVIEGKTIEKTLLLADYEYHPRGSISQVMTNVKILNNKSFD